MCWERFPFCPNDFPHSGQQWFFCFSWTTSMCFLSSYLYAYDTGQKEQLTFFIVLRYCFFFVVGCLLSPGPRWVFPFPVCSLRLASELKLSELASREKLFRWFKFCSEALGLSVFWSQPPSESSVSGSAASFPESISGTNGSGPLSVQLPVSEMFPEIVLNLGSL